MTTLTIQKDAGFSACRTWRWWLSRTWTTSAARNPLVVCGLNPSTADETLDDPTIRRCMGFARDWGADGLLMLNAYAFRATDPRDLFAAEARGACVVGDRNNEAIRENAAGRRVLCAWGKNVNFGRALEVMKILKEAQAEPVCLGVNLDNSPKHVLYLPKTAKPMPYRLAGA